MPPLGGPMVPYDPGGGGSSELQVYGQPLAVDTDELRGVAQRLTGPSGRLSSALARTETGSGLLSGSVLATGAAAEAIGSAESIGASLARLIGEVDDLGEELRAVAAEYEQTEAAARARDAVPNFAAMPLPLLAGPQDLLGIGAAVLRIEASAVWAMWEGARHGQRAPTSAGASSIVQTVASTLFPHAADPVDALATLAVGVMGMATVAAAALGVGGAGARHAASPVIVHAVPAPGDDWQSLDEPPEPRPAATDVDELVHAIGDLYPDESGRPGMFRIDRVVAEDGAVSWQVFIPGTQGGIFSSNPMDWSENPDAFAGRATPGTEMVVRALQEVGVQADEPIVIAGHSQGGLLAYNVANDPRVAGAMDVRAIITAGAPTARIPTPDGAEVLSIEHFEDPVHGLDAASDPVTGQVTTVVRDLHTSANPLDSQITGPGGSHDIPAYERTATLIAACDDPSVQSFLEVSEPTMPESATAESFYFQGLQHVEGEPAPASATSWF